MCNQRYFIWVVVTVGLLFTQIIAAGPTTKPADEQAIPIELPKPQFTGTPNNLPAGVKVEKNKIGQMRKPFLAPKGTVNVARDKKATSSDSSLAADDLKQITDGDKEANDGSFVQLASRTQWVQVDLEKSYDISAIAFWQRHGEAAPRIFRDVVVQVADDPDFIKGVTTLFNNDYDNSSGLGIGKDFEYIETYEGKLVDGKKTKARYVRIYSNGNTADAINWWLEIEVYAMPIK